jgi:hypothetical protein
MSDDGELCGTVFHVAGFETPLLSSQLAAFGNSVVIDKAGARIVNEKAGKTMKLVKRVGMFVLRMWLLVSQILGLPGCGGKQCENMPRKPRKT